MFSQAAWIRAARRLVEQQSRQRARGEPQLQHTRQSQRQRWVSGGGAVGHVPPALLLVRCAGQNLCAGRRDGLPSSPAFRK
jgi:hypothetical protein